MNNNEHYLGETEMKDVGVEFVDSASKSVTAQIITTELTEKETRAHETHYSLHYRH